jgi:hypothetical protein
MTRDELVTAMRRAGWEVTGLHIHGAYEVWTRPGAPYHARVTLPAAFVMFTAEGREMLRDAVNAFARAEGPRLLVAVEAVLAVADEWDREGEAEGWGRDIRAAVEAALQPEDGS